MGIIKTIGVGFGKLIHKALPLVTAGGVSTGVYSYLGGDQHTALLAGGVGVGAQIIHEAVSALSGRPKQTKQQKAETKKAKIDAKIAKLNTPKVSRAQKKADKLRATLQKVEGSTEVTQTPPPS